MMRAAVLALTVAACGGGAFASSTVDAGDLPDAAGDVAQGDAGDAAGELPDVASDVVNAGEVPEVAGDAVDEHEAGACTPVSYPISPPPGCENDLGPQITGPGSLWLLQTESQPPYCTSRPLAGAAACEACRETFTCACLAPYLADAGMPWTKGPTGTGCVDGPSGPYWSQ